MTNWTTTNIPSQKSRSAVVTGTGGLGFEDALALARAGCDVIIAGRNARKGAEAVATIRNEVPSARVWFEHRSCQSSVRNGLCRTTSQPAGQS